MRKIKIIEIKSDIGAATPGAGSGVNAVKEATLKSDESIFDDVESVEIPNANYIISKPVVNPLAKRIKSIYAICKNLSEEVCDTLNDEKFPIVLAGDHSTSGGTISGIKMAYPDSRIGVIWIDAHPDMHSPYTTPSGNMHGMPLGFVLNEDNKGHSYHDPNEETLLYWNLLKNLGNIAPKVYYSDVVFVSIRDIDKAEKYLINKYKIRNYSVNDISSKGASRVAEKILDYLDTCNYIYISFDVDSLDPSESVGTGTPVKKGLYVDEVIKIIRTLMKDKRVCCLEIAEVNPRLDIEKPMANIASEVLSLAISQLLNPNSHRHSNSR